MYELYSPAHYNVPFLVDKCSGLTPTLSPARATPRLALAEFAFPGNHT
jgi:hypothetical protein